VRTGVHGIASISSPWGSVTCGAGGPLYRSTAGEKASQAALPSADGTIGLAQLQFDKSQALLPAGS